MFSASKTGATGGYQIPNSLRFRSSASAYLNRTPASASNRTTWTWSAWVKRGALGGGPYQLFAARTGASATYTLLYINNDNLIFADSGGAGLVSTAVYRDPSSWYHIICAVDTTQSTASNRVSFYVNGQQITSFSSSTYPTQNATLNINSTADHFIGQQVSLQYFDGYMAEINFINGQALTPSSFGSFNAITGVWQPARYSGTYGTNGFYLKFNNGTSTTTLGYDTSGNGNNWTTNNISLTAGSTYDWMLDSPTPFIGSSYGVGNYAVLSPITPSITTTYAPTSGNLNVTLASQGQAISTIAATSGKWYAELVMSSGTVSTDTGFGFQPPTTYSATFCAGASSLGYVYFADGRKGYNGTYTTYGNTWTLNDVIGVALDLDNGKVYWSKNGTWQASGDPVAGTNAAYTGVSGTFAFVIRNGNSATDNKAFSINFGQRPFAYTPPSGFKSLCTQNLPAPTIANGAKYMAATTYTGTGSSLSISNAVNSVSFQPDFVWIKNRGNTTSHVLQDSIRGAGKSLFSNATAAESGNTGDLISSFNASGFTVNDTYLGGSGGGGTDGSGYTYIGWQWKAGGTAVSNTSGTITSSVSANTTAGFSVVTYTGTGANATVGHGLGVAPSMVVFKVRSTTNSWLVYHVSVGATAYLLLDSTAASTTSALAFNNTAPTSSVFTISTGNAVNQSAQTYVAYCFTAIAGYSAFGSYTGNGSTDGPFVYCGFRPRFVMVKRTDAADSWGIFDSSRDTYNAENALLRAESANAEASLTSLVGNPFGDFLSNGFKVRNTSTLDNTSGGTYIYAAFAENPFQNSLAR